jgi:hypothetical protein
MTFEVGDKVWLSAKHIQTARPSKKLGYKRLNPSKITKVIIRNAYRLELPYSMKVPRLCTGWIRRSVAMSTAAYGIEAIWKGQTWLLNEFNRLTVAIGRYVAGTFNTAKGEDATTAADIPPAKPVLDRRSECLLASALAAPEGTPKRHLLPPRATDDSSRHRIPRLFSEASDNNRLVKEGRQVETSSPSVRLKTPWTIPKDGVDLYGWIFRRSRLTWLVHYEG